MRRRGHCVFFLLAVAIAPCLCGATVANNDSCDISTLPAATLLLPYFQVDLASPTTTTLFTVQNVSAQPRIANVTLWTDWAFPALSFPIYLTGYDVQSINLYDVLAKGTIAQGGPPAPGCTLPTSVPGPLLANLQLLFRLGKAGSGPPVTCPLANDAEAQVGGVHSHAIGYATIDLVASCTASKPNTPDYFAGTILFDNVLTGDVQQLYDDGAKRWAHSSPLVHLRALNTSPPYTFYDHYTGSAKGIDRRQPLPAVFAPRLIHGSAVGFSTLLKIWREGAAVNPGCADYAANSNMRIADIIRFDEHENATVRVFGCVIECPPGEPGLPAAASVSSFSAIFPPPPASSDVGGWLYLNLDNGSSSSRASQNWVTTSMFAAPTYAVESAAPALGNGCSPAIPRNATIGPAP